jgi:hypothetical protein
VTLPYWDWTLDFGAELESQVLHDFGEIQYEASCLTGAFAEWDDPVSDTCVSRRNFSSSETRIQNGLPPFSEVELAVSSNNTWYWINLYVSRNLHKAAHVLVGGDEGTLNQAWAPADPAFWMHHCNLDRIWAIWADCYDYDINLEAGYSDLSTCECVGIDDDIVDTLENTTYTVRSLLDIHSLGYSYPPLMDDINKLSGNSEIYVANTCKWDWFDKSKQLALGLSPRPTVHTDAMRSRLSSTQIAYLAELSSTGDYHAAMVKKIEAECNLYDGYSTDYMYTTLLKGDDEGPAGPAILLQNVCLVVKADQLLALVGL